MRKLFRTVTSEDTSLTFHVWPGTIQVKYSTTFTLSRQHKHTLACCSMAHKPPKVIGTAVDCSCTVTRDVLREECGRTNKQTNKHGKSRAILGPAIHAPSW